MRHLMLLGFLAACSSGPTSIVIGEPAELTIGGGRFRFAITASRSELRAGQPDTLRATLTNIGSSDVNLTFGSGCQIVPLIRDAGGTIVLPGGGGYVCTAAITYLPVAAGETVVREWVWTGGTELASEMPLRPLPAGTYYATAMLGQSNGPETPRVVIHLTH